MLLPKPEPYAKVKARRERLEATRRRKCVGLVWWRAQSRCERCGRPVIPPADCEGWEPWRGDVNEKIPRSKGGDPGNPDHCELICQGCHFSGPSGAHAPTAERGERERTIDF